MICTPIVVESAEYCPNLEDQASGLSDIVSIFLHQDVATYPAYKATADIPNGITQMMADVRAAAAITMKASKYPIKLPCIIEQNGLQTKDLGKGGWMTDIALRIQNTEHNRGVIKSLKGARFTAAVKEIDGDMLLVGQSDGVSTQFLARIKPESIDENTGKAFSDDRYIDFIIEAKPYKPVTYNFAIAYS